MRLPTFTESVYTRLDKQVISIRLNMRDFSWQERHALLKLLGETVCKWRDSLPAKKDS